MTTGLSRSRCRLSSVCHSSPQGALGWRVASFTFLSAIGLGCSFWQLLLLVGEQYAFAFAPFSVFEAKWWVCVKQLEIFSFTITFLFDWIKSVSLHWYHTIIIFNILFCYYNFGKFIKCLLMSWVKPKIFLVNFGYSKLIYFNDCKLMKFLLCLVLHTYTPNIRRKLDQITLKLLKYLPSPYIWFICSSIPFHFFSITLI